MAGRNIKLCHCEDATLSPVPGKESRELFGVYFTVCGRPAVWFHPEIWPVCEEHHRVIKNCYDPTKWSQTCPTPSPQHPT